MIIPRSHRPPSGSKVSASRSNSPALITLSLQSLLSILLLAIVGPLGDGVGQVQADQPVHCVRSQVYGVWHFYLTKEAEELDLFKVHEVCTHQTPNKLQIIGANHQWSFQNADLWQLHLLQNHKVEATSCKDNAKQCDGQKISGTWSLVYDQALEIQLADGLRFMANFKYTVKPKVADNQDPLNTGSEQFESLKTGDYNDFDSHCNQTMVGFVQSMPSIRTNDVSTMKKHRVQCLYGVQMKRDNVEKTVQVRSTDAQPDIAYFSNRDAIIKEQSNVQIGSEALDTIQSSIQMLVSSFNRNSATHAKRINAHLSHVPSEEFDQAISYINENDFGWKADVCKLQTHHKDFGAHCNQAGAKNQESNLLQVAEGSGSTSGDEIEQEDSTDIAKNGRQFGEDTEEFKKALAKAQKWGKKYKSARDIPDSAIPSSYDYTNIDGYDFTNPIRDQGACGSCYTASFVQVIESRLKLKYGKNVPELSMQQLMQCNYLNEGCDGGWSLFQGYFTENAHMVSEKCAPYKAKTKGQTCSDYARCPTEAKVLSSYFIGGAYGESSEKRIMKELMHGGIINGELQVPQIFGSYHSGIMSEKYASKVPKMLAREGFKLEKEVRKSAGHAVKKVTDKDLKDYGIAFMKLNHSVVIVGWGVDQKGTKYWKVRNSYGPSWGLAGHFLVRRGQNDFGIESESTAYSAIKCKPNTTSFVCEEDI